MSSVWEVLPQAHSLSFDHIDVWHTSLALPPSRVQELYGLLDHEEQGRVARYKSEKRCNEFIITRGLLRQLLGDLFKIAPPSITFLYTDRDKPYLESATLGAPVCFNISHSHESAVIAIGLERRMGIDIEKIRADVAFEKLARRYFSVSEAEIIDRCSDSLRPLTFFQCWSRKEAFVKALGDGLSFGLGEFAVSMDKKQGLIELRTDYDPADAANWKIMSIDSVEGYALAICSNRPDYHLRLWRPA